MATVKIKIEVKDRGALKAYRDLYDIRRVKERLYRSMAAGLREVRARTLSILQTEPPPARHPIRWKSDRQRKAVMAYLRENGYMGGSSGPGNPIEATGYIRTHKMSQAWKVEQVAGKSGGEISQVVIENRHKAKNAVGDEVYPFQFVYGTFEDTSYQQPFHADTGWKSLPVVVQDARDAVMRAVRKTIAQGEENAKKGRRR